MKLENQFKEQLQIIELMEAEGFKFSSAGEIVPSLHFTIDLSKEDSKKMKEKCVGKNTFIPRGYRSVHVFESYVTSSIHGEIRVYRGRNFHGGSLANIFAYTHNGNKNPLENVILFIEKYKKLEYNIS